MASCGVCGTDIAGVKHFVCNHCRATVCPQHRIPERHDCPHADRLSPPETYPKHVDTAAAHQRAGVSKHATAEPDPERERVLSPAEAIRPESYPVRRDTEPISDADTAPGGKRHRDWEPDSSSPDLNPDGSLTNHQPKPTSPTTSPRHRQAVLVVLLALAVTGITISLYLF